MSTTPGLKEKQHTRSLFRAEAMEHASIKKFGTVILTYPVSFKILTTVFVAIAIFIVWFFLVFSTTKKAEASGLLLPTSGVIRIIHAQTGIIKEKYVKNGQKVKAGQIMFTISSERNISSLSAEKKVSILLERQLTSFQAEIKQINIQGSQRIAAARRVVENTVVENKRISGQINLQRQRVELSDQSVKRYFELAEKNYISSAQLQDKQAELLDQRQRLEELERAYATGQRELATADANLRELELQIQRETKALDRNISTLEQNLAENETRREIPVRAPLNGLVTAISAEVGQTVTSNMTLASILPEGAELEAEIYVPSRSIGFVKPGMLVLLRYQAYPYQKFGQYRAHIREISDTSLRSDELGLPQSTSPEPIYRIRLTLESQTVKAYGQQVPLKSGMLLNASIHLDKRRLYEWILEPLFSISRRG